MTASHEELHSSGTNFGDHAAFDVWNETISQTIVYIIISYFMSLSFHKLYFFLQVKMEYNAFTLLFFKQLWSGNFK